QRLGYGMGTRLAFALEHGRCLPVQLFAFVKAPLEGIYPSLKCQSLGEFATARSVCNLAGLNRPVEKFRGLVVARRVSVGDGDLDEVSGRVGMIGAKNTFVNIKRLQEQRFRFLK